MTSKANPDVEALAVEVGQHPDYRVLRRLDTSIAYPALAGPNVARAVILDTETTGMEFGTDKVIELGLVVFEYERTSGQVGQVLGTYNALEDPGIAIPASATAVHGMWGRGSDGSSSLGGLAAQERRVGAAVSRGEGVTALKMLLDRAREPTYRVWATGSDFDTKDVLKARQYRWDPEERCWWIEVDAGGLDGELTWLKTAVYAGRSAKIEVEALDARVRYSGRSGKRERRAL